ncbi:hypothetical protein AYI70_g2234 [Smittium culicis]|uniref:Uncharacterized protein n=1 Tax=Smittium culicis TaxID=133412 RepID=A0A1R1Y990_9FUNG|nr:hypothetical protein AYI70_g2234 [Smittium culicis]
MSFIKSRYQQALASGKLLFYDSRLITCIEKDVKSYFSRRCSAPVLSNAIACFIKKVREFVEQGTDLDSVDFDAVVNVISRIEEPTITFYNSGDDSGARFVFFLLNSATQTSPGSPAYYRYHGISYNRDLA